MLRLESQLESCLNTRLSQCWLSRGKADLMSVVSSDHCALYLRVDLNEVAICNPDLNRVRRLRCGRIPDLL